MNRQELRDAVRAQTDLDEEDLPNGTLDLFLREAFERTAAFERRWPTFETIWSASTVGGQIDLAALTPEVNEISTVVDVSSSNRLCMYDHNMVEENFRSVSGRPQFFSLWASNMYLWPIPADGTEIVVRGWSKPTYDWLTNPGMEVSLEQRLHIPIYHFAVALAYAQQEDEILEQVYMNRWRAGLETIRNDIMRVDAYAPMVLQGGTPQPFGWNGITWNF